MRVEVIHQTWLVEGDLHDCWNFVITLNCGRLVGIWTSSEWCEILGKLVMADNCCLAFDPKPHGDRSWVTCGEQHVGKIVGRQYSINSSL